MLCLNNGNEKILGEKLETKLKILKEKTNDELYLKKEVRQSNYGTSNKSNQKTVNQAEYLRE